MAAGYGCYHPTIKSPGNQQDEHSEERTLQVGIAGIPASPDNRHTTRYLFYRLVATENPRNEDRQSRPDTEIKRGRRRGEDCPVIPDIRQLGRNTVTGLAKCHQALRKYFNKKYIVRPLINKLSF